MVELNFFDANGNVVLNLPNLQSINNHFNNSLDISNPQSLIMDFMMKHNRVTYNGVLYFFETTKINNTEATIKLGYKELV